MRKIIQTIGYAIPRSPHFYVIGMIIAVLAFIYYDAWPWVWRTITGNVWYRGEWFSWLGYLGYLEFRYHNIGSLFYIPTSYAAIVFRWRGGFIAWLFSLAIMLPLIIEIWQYNIGSMIPNIIFLLLPMLVISIIMFELQWRTRERRIQSSREEERQRYIAQVLEAQENERQRIAQELHDDTIQTLLVILGYSESLISINSPLGDEVKKNAIQIRDTTVSAVENLRRMTLDLRPSILDNLGLIPALRWLVDRLNRECEIHARILINGIERKLSPREESIIFRIVQEALNNIKRHSQAREAVVTLEFRQDSLRIIIKDDGKGFSVPRDIGWFANIGSVGIIGMQQRISSLGGRFQIHSNPQKGTTLIFEIEYQNENHYLSESER